MIVYRLSKEKYKHELSGYGASLQSNRWNSKGTEIVYTAQSRALATCEVAVHIPLGILPKNYHMLEVEIPDSITIHEVPINDLPLTWNSIPHHPLSQKIGDDFINENKFAVLKVPSAVVKDDYNYLLNPKHQDFHKIKILRTTHFPFDPRLFDRKN